MCNHLLDQGIVYYQEPGSLSLHASWITFQVAWVLCLWIHVYLWPVHVDVWQKPSQYCKVIMASPTRWTWVWVNSGSWWWTGRPGVLQFTGSQRVRDDWATELNYSPIKLIFKSKQTKKCEQGFPDSTSGKEPACQCRRCRFEPWVGKIPRRRPWQPTWVFLPGESHGQRSLAGYSP